VLATNFLDEGRSLSTVHFVGRPLPGDEHLLLRLKLKLGLKPNLKLMLKLMLSSPLQEHDD
jgi:hypothetical protein